MSISLSFLATISAPLIGLDEVSLPDRYIRVGDVADVDDTDGAILAAIPEGKTKIVLTSEDAARLIRNRLPGTPFDLKFDEVVTLTAPSASVTRGACFVAKWDLATDQIVRESDVEATACLDQLPSRDLGYDHSRRAVVVRHPIMAGEYLGSVKPAKDEAVAAGNRMVFRTSNGVVSVEREVVALQAGTPGKTLFARTENGEVIVARLGETGEASE